MRCFVTGATGFIGSNLVHALNQQGHDVVALIRPGANRLGLQGARYTVVEGDVLDRRVLEKGMSGCDWCFHVAAVYSLWSRNERVMEQVNVEGTRNVLEAAAQAGCRRIVYTSTVGCLIARSAADGSIRPVTEDEVAPFEFVKKNPYKRTKWLAEQKAIELARKGAPIVIVNPTAPIGPRDVKPTPTGRIIIDFVRGAMPGYVQTGLNWVHVQDVAIGHILAAEKGRVGERYILGNRDGNWTLAQTLEYLARITGRPIPRLKIPYSVAYVYALINELSARLTGREPHAPVAAVRMARYWMFFDPSKAIRELGLPQTPVEVAFQDALSWFRQNGYL